MIHREGGIEKKRARGEKIRIMKKKKHMKRGVAQKPPLSTTAEEELQRLAPDRGNTNSARLYFWAGWEEVSARRSRIESSEKQNATAKKNETREPRRVWKS